MTGRDGMSRGRNPAWATLLATGFSAGLAATAAAACPEGRAAALAGVVVVYDDEAETTYRLEADGRLFERTLFDPDMGDGYDVVSLHGIYVLEEYDVIDGMPALSTRERTEFEGGLAVLPAPAPGLEWEGTATHFPPYDDPHPRTVRVRIGEAGTVRYGDCAYESWPVSVDHVDATDGYGMGFDYLPALEIAVFRAHISPGYEPDSYTPVAIRPLAR